MKRSWLILNLIFPVWLFGQVSRIESVRRSIPLLKDSVRIDSMNELSLLYIHHSVKDSAEYYARTAYNLSRALHYIHGEAESLSRQGNIKTYFYNNYVEAEKLDEHSIDLFNSTTNSRGLSDTYGQLSYACFAQGKYDEALQIAKLCYNLSRKNMDEAGMADILDLFT